MGAGLLDPRWLWCAVSLWLLLAVSLLAGAPRPAAVALGGAALALALLFFRPMKAAIGPLASFFFVLALWTTLSAIPLPCSWVGRVAPIAGAIWTDALSPLGTSPLSYCSLSVAPAATVQSALNWSSYAVMAVAAGALAGRVGLAPILLSVLGVSVLVALLTLIHALLGIEHLFGISWLPAKTSMGPASVLVNPNNLAGYMNLGAFSALALLGSRHPPIPRALLVAGGALCVATVISSASRGGVLSLAFGVFAWAILLVMRRFSSSRGVRSEVARQVPFVLVVVLAGVLIAALGSNPDLERELFGDDVGKARELGLLATSLERIDWSGVGRGAFDSVSARLTNEGRNFTHEYAENFVLSWLLEWGPWVGSLALVALCWLLAPGRLRVRGHASAECAWLGLVVLLLQNLADLGLELPGLAGAFAVVGAALEGSRDSRGSRAAPRAVLSGDSDRPRLLVALMGLLLVTASWALSTGPSLAATRARVQDSVERASGPSATKAARSAAWGAIAEGLERYPAEPYFVLVGGWLALEDGKDAMPWAAESLRRAPRSARAHVLVAEVLARRGAIEQALLHVRRAAEADPELTPTLAVRIARLTTDVRQLEAAAPTGVTGARFLLEISSALPVGVPPRARRHLLRLAVQRAPDDVRVQAAEAWALLGDLRAQSSPCPLTDEEEACAVEPGTRERILSLAERTTRTPACDGLRIHAALLAEEGRGSAAVDLLASCPSCAAPGNCAKDRVEFALAHGDEDERQLAVGAFRSGMCDGPVRCADAESWLSILFARRQQPELALVHAWRAAETDPSAARYLAAARAARAAGRRERVQVALDRARRWGGRDVELEEWVAERPATGTEALK